MEGYSSLITQTQSKVPKAPQSMRGFLFVVQFLSRGELMYAGAVLDAAVNNIPTTYSAAAGSKVISSTPSGGLLGFINTTTEVLAYTVGSFLGGKVPDSTLPGQSGFIPAAPSGGSGVSVIDGIKLTSGDSVYIRSTSGSLISSGKVYTFIK